MSFSFGNETDFPAHLWRSFAECRPPILCSPGFLIYLQGTDATCFYYLKQGRVKSFIQSEQGEERVLNFYQSGSLFGAASFLDELPRVSSAVALTPCQLIPIDRELVAGEIAQDPELALSMMKYLARTIRHLSNQVDQMAFRPATWRIARHLLSLPCTDNQLPCTQDDIAACVSVSRVTVSRILNDLARDGLLALGYRRVTLLNRPALQALCQN